MKLKKALSSSIRWIKNNSSLCLSVVSGVGVVATAALSADAAVRTNELVYEKRDQDRIDIINRYALQDKEYDLDTIYDITPTENYKLTTKETIDIWWKPVTVGGLTLASIIFNHKLNMAKQASLVAAAGAIGNMYGQYRGAVIKEYGKEADDKIVESIVKADTKHFSVDDFYFATDPNDIVTFYDDCVGYFEMTPYQMLKAQYHLNRIIATNGIISLKQWFECLGVQNNIRDVRYCEEHGFCMDELYCQGFGESWFTVSYCGRVLDDGMKVLELDYGIPIIELTDEAIDAWR